MCATCVAQGVAYVGGAVAGLQVMAARARQRGPSPARHGGVDMPAGEPDGHAAPADDHDRDGVLADVVR